MTISAMDDDPRDAGVDSPADRRSWGILAGREIDEEPVDRAAGVEIAQDAIPTPAWTAHRTRRPQLPTGVLD